MSDYDRPSAPPHILANALQDPVDLPPGRGRAAKSARVSAPGGPSAAAVEAVAVHMFALACGAPLAVSRRWFRGEGIDKEDRAKFLSHAHEALAEALIEVREETIRECVALADALKDTYRKVQGHDPQSAAYHDGKVHAAEYLADALCALLPITALCALLPITEEGTDE